MTKKNEIKPTFKIHEVNRIRAIRTNKFIRKTSV